MPEVHSDTAPVGSSLIPGASAVRRVSLWPKPSALGLCCRVSSTRAFEPEHRLSVLEREYEALNMHLNERGI